MADTVPEPLTVDTVAVPPFAPVWETVIRSPTLYPLPPAFTDMELSAVLAKAGNISRFPPAPTRLGCCANTAAACW